MNNYSFALLLLGSILSGCGQPGPLYLPTAKPPVYVEPESTPEAKETGSKEAKPGTPLKQEIAPKLEVPKKPENSPQPKPN